MIKHECDETCRGCPKCYLRTGETLCDKICEHAIREKGFLIDLDNPDGMYADAVDIFEVTKKKT